MVLEKQERILEQSRELKKDGKQLEILKEQRDALEKKKEAVLDPIIKEIENNLNNPEPANEDSGIDDSGDLSRKRPLEDSSNVSQDEESQAKKRAIEVEAENTNIWREFIIIISFLFDINHTRV